MVTVSRSAGHTSIVPSTELSSDAPIRFSISTQLAAGFGVVVLLLAIVAVVGWRTTTNFAGDARSLYTESLAPEVQLGKAQQALYELSAGEVAPGYADADPGTQATMRANDTRWQKQLDENLQAFRLANTLPAEVEAMKTWDETYPAFLASREQVITLNSQGKTSEAQALRNGQMWQNLEKNVAILQQLIQSQERDGDAINANVHATADSTNRLLLALSLLALGVAGGIAVFLSRRIGGAVKAIARASTALALGDLKQEIPIRSRDELGQMAHAFRTMVAYQGRMADAAEAIACGRLPEVLTPASEHDTLGVSFQRMTENISGMARVADAIGRGDLSVQVQPKSSDDVLGVALERMASNLRQLVAEIQHGSHNLSGTSAELFAATSQQAAGTAEQSAAIAQTTTTVEEVRASAEQSTSLALTVVETARQANDVAGSGVSAIRSAADGMEDIGSRVQAIADNMLVLSQQNEQIGEIIATVNDLADQSNLLALNAAIEASRAGEHGRGFTVVASEIRTLAEQSRAATAQVRGILSDIQRATNSAVLATELGTKGVDAGRQRITQAGRTIEELADVIRDTAASTEQIAVSVRQHAVGMEQISAAMANISQATSQSAAATANTHRAAENLTQLAGSLDQLVNRYRLQ